VAISAFRVAQKLCALSDWSLTNLQLQKLLYLSHLLYLGENEEPLILEPFQAWKFGPVLPQVYNRVKIFKDRPVLNIFYGVEVLSENDSFYSKEACFLKNIYQKLARKTARQLVIMTHLKEGAWEKAYIRAPFSALDDEDILQEYERYYKNEEI